RTTTSARRCSTTRVPGPRWRRGPPRTTVPSAGRTPDSLRTCAAPWPTRTATPDPGASELAPLWCRYIAGAVSAGRVLLRAPRRAPEAGAAPAPPARAVGRARGADRPIGAPLAAPSSEAPHRDPPRVPGAPGRRGLGGLGVHDAGRPVGSHPGLDRS